MTTIVERFQSEHKNEDRKKSATTLSIPIREAKRKTCVAKISTSKTTDELRKMIS